MADVGHDPKAHGERHGQRQKHGQARTRGVRHPALELVPHEEAQRGVPTGRLAHGPLAPVLQLPHASARVVTDDAAGHDDEEHAYREVLVRRHELGLAGRGPGAGAAPAALQGGLRRGAHGVRRPFRLGQLHVGSLPGVHPLDEGQGRLLLLLDVLAVRRPEDHRRHAEENRAEDQDDGRVAGVPVDQHAKERAKQRSRNDQPADGVVDDRPVLPGLPAQGAAQVQDQRGDRAGEDHCL
mmetsp:Transcript_73045/g.225877  ORF Transcript_73045/g.225877 Transcript_73045/m.225877 type:complete len:239 (-) Transcript_73045:393-1109(-)